MTSGEKDSSSSSKRRNPAKARRAEATSGAEPAKPAVKRKVGVAADKKAASAAPKKTRRTAAKPASEPALETPTATTATAASQPSPPKRRRAKPANGGTATLELPLSEPSGPTSCEPSFEAIQLRAWLISEQRRAEGRDGDSHGDWVEAERQLRHAGTAF